MQLGRGREEVVKRVVTNPTGMHPCLYLAVTFVLSFKPCTHRAKANAKANLIGLERFRSKYLYAHQAAAKAYFLCLFTCPK